MSDETFTAEGTRLLESLMRYLEESRAGKTAVIRQPPMAELAAALRLDDWVAEGGLTGEALGRFYDDYLSYTTRLHHPGFMAHQVSAPDIRASLSHLVDGFTNNGMNIYEMGPPAATIEYFIVNWMLKQVGWQPRPWPDSPQLGKGHGGGVLTHGGSLANLTALLAARAAAFPQAWQAGYQVRPAILAPACNHYSVKRAAGIMGLGTDAVLELPTDDHNRIIAGRIAEIHAQALAQGYAPFAMVANSCSTAVGIYDPLQEIAPVAKSLGLWLHVDGAHGAGALVSARHRHLLAGVKEADSMIWDAHKMLATPALCAAVLFKNGAHLDLTFQQEASYLFHEKDEPGYDFMPRSVECTKAAMGLRFFTVLAARGEVGLGEHVARLYELGQHAWNLFRQRPGFRCPVRPQSNIVCFSYGPEDERHDDELQLKIRRALTHKGDFYITSTLFRGARYLRLALMNPLTDDHILVGLMDAVEEEAAGFGMGVGQ